MKHWVFDLDGTLVDSFGPYFDYVGGLIARPLSLEERHAAVSHSPVDFIGRYLPAERVSSAIETLRAESRRHAEGIRAFEHVEDSLEQLRASGAKCVVWTNRDLASAERILEITGLRAHFGVVLSGECAPRKPQTPGFERLRAHFGCRHDEIRVVGDHDDDMLTAKNSGARAVRASWHPHWAHPTCSISERQFYSTREFHDWLRHGVNERTL